MKTYKQTFEKLKSKKQIALIAFTVISDPDYETSLEITKKIIESGVDMLELGLPFSDPIADGATIQAADERAIKSGMNTNKAFQFLKEIRKYTDIPIGLLSYYNLIYQFGIEKFYQNSAKAGLNSILIADMPIEESSSILECSKKNKIDSVFMISPLTDNKRILKIAQNTTGFIYLVSRLGVTGARYNLENTTLELIKRTRKFTKKPLCVGFGICSPMHVKSVAKAGADGAIVGSGIVDLIAKNLKNKEKMLKEISLYIKEMKNATRI